MPYSERDEYHIHQLPRPVDTVHTSDASWSDRNYFFAHSPDGDILIVAGWGNYPNGNKGSGYANIALADGRHFDLMVGGPMGGITKPGVLEGGVLSWTCVEPLKSWKVALAPNESGVEFEMFYSPRLPMWELLPLDVVSRTGEQLADQYHIKEPGQWTGWLQIDGERTSVDGWHGGRDRTFGVRNAEKIDFWLWLDVGFEDFAIEAWVFEDAQEHALYVDGGIVRADGTRSKRFVKIEHDVQFDGDRKRPARAAMVFTDEDGATYRVDASSVHQHVNANYGHPLRSKIKHTDHGNGQYTVVCNWDAANDEDLTGIEKATISLDQLMRFEMDGYVGWGVFELLMGGVSYPRYANWKPMDMTKFVQ